MPNRKWAASKQVVGKDVKPDEAEKINLGKKRSGLDFGVLVAKDKHVKGKKAYFVLGSKDSKNIVLNAIKGEWHPNTKLTVTILLKKSYQAICLPIFVRDIDGYLMNITELTFNKLE